MNGERKGAATRAVAIHPRLRPVLEACHRKDNHGYLFPAPPSNRYPAGDHHLNPRTVNEQFKALATKHGFDVGRSDQGLTLHALRRTFKTACLDAGVPEPLVNIWLGHEDASGMNKHYYRPQQAHQWMARVPFGEPSAQEIKTLTQLKEKKGVRDDT